MNNLNNQGLSEVTVTSGTAKYVTGKIGAKALDLSSRITLTCPQLEGVKKFSIMFWARVDDNSSLSTNWNRLFMITDQKADNSQAGNLRFETCYGATGTGVLRGIHLHNNTTYAITNYSPNFYTAEWRGEWHHVAITCDSDTGIQAYTDGELIGSSTTVYGGHLMPTIYLGETDNISGAMNDLRIYDEVVSAKMISEIAKGLVCHYTLAMPGNDNLLRNTNVSSTAAGKTGFILGSAIPSGTTVTLSVQIDAVDLVLSGNKKIGFEGSETNGTDRQYIGAWTYKQGTFSERISKTVTVTRDFPVGNATFGIYIQTVSSGSCTISNPKIEIGSVATPWTPNPADPEYTKMGFDDGIEYDVSGYGHNGTKTGTITHDVDTPRYWTSSKFSSSDISADPLPSSVITISFWYKPLLGSSYIVFADTGTGLCFGRENDHINTGISSSARADAISSSGFANNLWYHIVIVKKSDTGRDVYVNGQKVDIVGNNYWTNNIAGLFIGKRQTSNLSPYYLDGNIVDFRAYVTALSADDILAIYNTPISLTSNGTLLTQGEFTEV